MNRKQFATEVAQAYMDQYHPQEWRRREVMNNPVIEFNIETGQFSSCSSLMPVCEYEIRLFEIEEGMFGSEGVTKAGIIHFLMNDSGLWNDAQETIATEKQWME